MNRYVNEKWSWIEGGHELRDGVLEQLSDADLSFSPGADNMSFGAAVRSDGRGRAFIPERA